MTPSDYPRCRTCKWWDDFPARKNSSECVNPKVDATPCNERLDELPVPGGLLARSPDASDTVILTDQNFGCAHHQDKG